MKRTARVRVSFGVGAVLLLCLSAASRGQTVHPYSDPRFAEVMSDAVLHLSFDGDSMKPDLVAGDPIEPKVRGSLNKVFAAPVFTDGVIGRGLVLGTGDATFPLPTPNPLLTRGAIAVWLKPETWNRDAGVNVNVIRTPTNVFVVQRQGPKHDPAGKVLRHENLSASATPSAGERRLSVYRPVPENGAWNLIVVNWAWPTFSISVNGNPFVSRSLPRTPDDPDAFASVIVGSFHGREDERAILDELYLFSRPLTREEALLLYNTLVPTPEP